MKLQKLVFFALICLFLTNCKKYSSDSDRETKEKLSFQSFKTMEAVANRFIEIGDSMNVAPPVALYYASLWAQLQPEVEYAFTLDSAFLIIHMKSGLEKTIALRKLDVDGLSVYRGGTGGTEHVSRISSFDSKCSHKIENKKILLYAAYEYQFYSGNEFQTRVVDKIKNGDVADINVTVLKNEQCTIDAMLTFNQYGLVILDTHGYPSSIYTGIRFNLDTFDIPENVDKFLTILGQKIGTNYVHSIIDAQIDFNRVFEYDPNLQNQEQWEEYKQNLQRSYDVSVTSKGIRELMPDLSQTIIFANACYSGWTATEWTKPGGTHKFKNSDPIKLAWMSRNPLVFYGYESTQGGVSYQAPNKEFCKPNEDTLIKSFFYDGDSTGNAHLSEQLGGAFFIEFPWNINIGMISGNHGPLRFNHYASPSWCYGNCGDSVKDTRDGKKYPTVCIGDQVWMAKNLDYAGAGVCYDGNIYSCDTYGRLYTWNEVTAGVSSNASPSGIKGICPNGWHVPSLSEWQKLINYVGGDVAARDKLRANSPLWEEEGTDDYGFALLPAGQCERDINSGEHVCFNLDDEVSLWTTSKEDVSSLPVYFLVSDGLANEFVQNSDVTDYRSCRCVKD